MPNDRTCRKYQVVPTVVHLRLEYFEAFGPRAPHVLHDLAREKMLE
jgi:hypothetical protein